GAPLRGEAEAEAGGDAQFLAGELERALELAREPAGGAHGVILAAAIGHDDDEGVAANPGDGVIGAGGVPKAVGENGQQLVARGVAERIVHALEVVEPDGENCYRLVEASRALEGLLKPLAQLHAVRKSCQCIMLRKECDGVGELLALRDVVGGGEVSGGLSVVALEGSER